MWIFPGVSGGGDFLFSNVEVTAINGTCSAVAVDDALATEEATSSPKLEAIALGRGRDCERQMSETWASDRRVR